MVCDVLHVGLDESSRTILEDKVRGLKLCLDSRLEPGIYTYAGGWLVLHQNNATVFTSPTYDLDYLRRAYAGSNLRESTLRGWPGELQVRLADSIFPDGFLSAHGIAEEQFKALVGVGDELEFAPYEKFNPRPGQLIPGEKYRVAGFAKPMHGRPVFIMDVGGQRLELGCAFFPASRLERGRIAPELASLGIVLQHLYKEQGSRR